MSAWPAGWDARLRGSLLGAFRFCPMLGCPPSCTLLAPTRPAGKHETSSIHDFSWGVANRGCSIRVGRMVPVEKCGYYEDRRPASNLDPYVVTRLICESALLM